MSRSYPPVYAIRYEITIGGKTYTQADAQIANLSVDTSLQKADKVKFKFNKPFEPEQGNFPDVNWDSISPKTPVKVSLGWGGQGSMTEIFNGKITKVQTNFSQGKGPTVDIDALGPIHEMKKGTPHREWAEKSDKKAKLEDVVNDVLNEGGYFDKTDVEAPFEREYVVQHDQSDYAFITDLAKKHTFRFYTSAGTAYFKPKSSVGTGAPVATLEYGDKLNSFNGSLDEATKVEQVEVRYWDMKKEKDITVTEGEGDSKKVFRIRCDSKSEAEDVAKNKHSELCEARVKGSGEADGNPKLVAGKVIKLKRMGSRFSQNYYITQATHRIGSSGYKTQFQAKEVPE